MNEITFGYAPDKLILKNVNFDVDFDTRIAIVGANGTGKSTLYVYLGEPIAGSKTRHSIKILTGELNPISGHVTRNGRLRV
jgi:ATP-binding cassette subfamily F protein 3